MFDALATALSWFYELTHSFGGAIMLLTLAIMVLLTPLTLKGTRSMIAMQRLQPEMKKLQNRYKDDRQKLNEEMMKFYKENSINPVGGCLPLLLQMPVFFVLYRVLIGLTDRAPYGSDMGRAMAMAARDPQASYAGFGHFEPNYLDQSSRLFQDLSSVSQMKSFGLNLADTASNVISQGVVKALPYVALIAIIGLTAWYQQKQIQGRNPQMAQVNPQQQMIMKIMPFFLPVISFTLPAGVVLYFLVSNLYRIGQQAFITRTMYGDAHRGSAGAIETTAREDAGPKPGLLAQLRDITAGGKGGSGNVAGSTKPSGGKGGSKAGAKPGRAADGSKVAPPKAPVAKAKGSGAKAKGSGGQPAAKKVGSNQARAKGSGARSAGSPPSRPPDRRPTPGSANGGSAEPKSTGPTLPAANGAGNGAGDRTSRAAPSRKPPPLDPNRSRTKKRRK